MRSFDYVTIVIVCIPVEFHSCDVKLLTDKQVQQNYQ